MLARVIQIAKVGVKVVKVQGDVRSTKVARKTKRRRWSEQSQRKSFKRRQRTNDLLTSQMRQGQRKEKLNDGKQ